MTSPSLPAAATAVLMLSTAALSACHGTDQPMAPDDTQAFVEAAPVLSLHEAVASLELSDEEAAALRPLAEELHASMMTTHRMMQDLEGREGEDLAAAHELLRAEIRGLRERHADFTGRLTPQQRESFMHHVHGQMEAHGARDGDAHGIHVIGHGRPDGR